MANNLLQARSLYLRKHADNPINWWYWCPEALAQAKAEDKPIFLSIGYSSCHWCTVMEGEAFSDDAIADYLNDNFIAIKVDREERPDLDSIYMTALQMMTGQGGWPLNIFLTPEDLVPFYGGTYFPVEPRYGRPGFLQILQSLDEFYHQQKDKLEALKKEILAGLQTNAEIKIAGEIKEELTEEMLTYGIERNSQVINRDDYSTPRFPMMPYTHLTLQGSKQNLETDCHGIARKRAINLVNGGIYDHVGGGFHRYTVDSTWTVPHFEKMLYDNGLIMEFLANLWASGSKVDEIKEACEGIYSWLTREMLAEGSYFYASQDADNFTDVNQDEPEEGDFYAWEYQQLKEMFSEAEFDAFEQTFYLSEKGNFEGKIVLQKNENKPINDTIKNCLQELFKVRYGQYPTEISQFPPARNNHEAKNIPWQGRIPPVTDTKMIVAWNSLMISGLARAYGVFRNSKYLDLAKDVAQFILNHQWQNNRLHRLNYDGQVATFAQAEDYALLIKALLDIHQNADGQCDDYLQEAIRIQQEFEHYCGDADNGGYFNNAFDNSDDLLVREKSYVDNATPSANGIAIANLVRLGLITGELEYTAKAEKTLCLFQQTMAKSAVSCPSLFAGLNWYLHGAIVKTNPDIKERLRQEYLPTTAYQTRIDLPEGSIGIVCQGLSCLEPATSQEQLLQQIGLTVDS